MTTRLLTITAVCLITLVSVTLCASRAAAGGSGWNQVAADAAARAYAAEGKCYLANGPCPAPGNPHPDKGPHVHPPQQYKWQ